MALAKHDRIAAARALEYEIMTSIEDPVVQKAIEEKVRVLAGIKARTRPRF